MRKADYLKISYAFLLLFSFTFLYAQESPSNPNDPSTWAVDASRFSFTMIMVGIIELNGIEAKNEEDIVGAFVGDECRGVAKLQYIPDVDRYIISLFIFTNTLRDSVDLRIFDSSSGRIFPHEERLAFVPNNPFGRFSDPYIFRNRKFSAAFEPTSPLCEGDTVGGLRIIETEGLTPPLRYKWSNEDTTLTINNLVAGPYFVTITDRDGFQHLDSFRLENLFEEIPPPPTEGAINGPVCSGNMLAITLTPPDSTLPWDLRWRTADGMEITTGFILETGALMQDTSFLVERFIRNCASTAVVIPIEVNIPDADFTVSPDTNLVQGDTVRFGVVNPIEGYRYVWNFGNGNLSAQTNPIHIYRESGAFEVTLRVIDSLGCERLLTYPQVLNVQAITNVEDLEITPFTMDIYPNPFSSNFTLKINSTTTFNAEFVLYNEVGQHLFNKRIFISSGKQEYKIDQLSNLPSGTYCIAVIGENGVKLQQSVIKLK